jgi:Zn-dependent M28 family amino/carboxypeptidase
MLKKLHIYLVLILAFLASSDHVMGRGTWFPNNKQIHNTIWEAKLKRDLMFVTDTMCTGRATGTPGNCATAFWLCTKFEKAGLVPLGEGYADCFMVDSTLFGHNIMGMLPGSRKEAKDKYIIVGAHYDHIGTLNGTHYPGADSNGTGTIALTSIAEMFSFAKVLGRSFSHNIIFCAFDGKERSMAGAKHLMNTIRCGELKDPITGKIITAKQISLMVNIDQIGGSKSLTTGREDFLIMLGRNKLKEDQRDLLSLCNRTYDLNLELSYSYFGSENFTDMFYNKLSDQAPFVAQGVPSVFFTTGITMNNNKPYDTADKINFTTLKKRIILIWQWITSVC